MLKKFNKYYYQMNTLKQNNYLIKVIRLEVFIKHLIIFN